MPRASRSQAPTPPSPRLVRKTARTTPAAQPPDARERVARRAYELFLENGSEHGHDVEHWLRAEQELLADAPPARPA